MVYEFNQINKLKLSKTKIIIITVFFALMLYPGCIIYVFLCPEWEYTKFAIFIHFGLFLVLGKFVEDNWLHKTRIIGVVTVYNDIIKIENETFYWKDVRDIKIDRYIKNGYGSTVANWKRSYKLSLIFKNLDNKTLYLSKDSINEDKMDLMKVLVKVTNIKFEIRKQIKSRIH